MYPFIVATTAIMHIDSPSPAYCIEIADCQQSALPFFLSGGAWLDALSPAHLKPYGRKRTMPPMRNAARL